MINNFLMSDQNVYSLIVVMNDYEREFEECKNDLETRLAKSEKAKTAL